MDKQILNKILEQVEKKITDKELPINLENIDTSDQDVVKILEMLNNISALFSETLTDYIDLLYKERIKSQDLGDNLRNPLAIIKGSVDMLEKSICAEQRKIYFNIIRQNLERIERCLEERKI